MNSMLLFQQRLTTPTTVCCEGGNYWTAYPPQYYIHSSTCAYRISHLKHDIVRFTCTDYTSNYCPTVCLYVHAGRSTPAPRIIALVPSGSHSSLPENVDVLIVLDVSAGLLGGSRRLCRREGGLGHAVVHGRSHVAARLTPVGRPLSELSVRFR